MMKSCLLCLLLAASSAHAAPVPAIDCPGYPRSAPAYTQNEAARARRDLEAAIANPGAENLVLAETLARVADSYADGFDRTTAEQLALRAYAIWSAATPTADLAEKLRGWGASDGRNARCVVAKPMLQASLGMFEKLYGPEDERTLRAVHDLLQVSISLADTGAVDELAPRLMGAWDKRGASAGVDRPALHLRLALFYLKLEQFAKAEALARPGLALAISQRPVNARLAADLSTVLAGACFGQLRYAEGVAALPKLAPFPVRQPPLKRNEDEIIAMARAGNLAAALARVQQVLAQDQAKLEKDQLALSEAEASPANAQQSEAARRAVAYDAANVANMLDWLGELHQGQGDLEQAQQAYLQALDLLAQHRPIDPLKVSRVQFDLAMLYRVRGEPARALPLLQEAMKTMLPLLGAEHPDVVDSEVELARIHKALGN